MALLPRPVTMMIFCMPEWSASSTPYWMMGLSTIGSISLGCALVAGRNRVPSPAAGKTAFRTFAIIYLILAASSCDNRSMRKIGLIFALALLSRAADYPNPVEGDFTIRDFHFHDGEELGKMTLH